MATTEGTVPFRSYRTWYRVVGGPPATGGEPPLLVVHGGPGLPQTTWKTSPGWPEGGRAVAADNGGGSFASHTFNTPAIMHGPPAVAVSSGSVVVGWTVPTTSFRAFVAKRVGATWTGTYASPPRRPDCSSSRGWPPMAGRRPR